MKKFLPVILIISGILLFIATIVISILSPKLPELIATYGFIILGYVSIIVFTVGIYKYDEQK